MLMNFPNSANQTHKVESCDQLMIPVNDLGGTELLPGEKKSFHKQSVNLSKY